MNNCCACRGPTVLVPGTSSEIFSLTVPAVTGDRCPSVDATADAPELTSGIATGREVPVLLLCGIEREKNARHGLVWCNLKVLPVRGETLALDAWISKSKSTSTASYSR